MIETGRIIGVWPLFLSEKKISTNCWLRAVMPGCRESTAMSPFALTGSPLKLKQRLRKKDYGLILSRWHLGYGEQYPWKGGMFCNVGIILLIMDYVPGTVRTQQLSGAKARSIIFRLSAISSPRSSSFLRGTGALFLLPPKGIGVDNRIF